MNNTYLHILLGTLPAIDPDVTSLGSEIKEISMLQSKGVLSLETTSSSPRNIIERGGREDEDHDSAPSEKEEDESSEDDCQLTDEDKEIDGS